MNSPSNASPSAALHGANLDAEPSAAREIGNLIDEAWARWIGCPGWCLDGADYIARALLGAGCSLSPASTTGVVRSAPYEALGRACEANGLAGFGDNGDMWFQPPIDAAREELAGVHQEYALCRSLLMERTAERDLLRQREGNEVTEDDAHALLVEVDYLRDARMYGKRFREQAEGAEKQAELWRQAALNAMRVLRDVAVRAEDAKEYVAAAAALATVEALEARFYPVNRP